MYMLIGTTKCKIKKIIVIYNHYYQIESFLDNDIIMSKLKEDYIDLAIYKCGYVPHPKL